LPIIVARCPTANVSYDMHIVHSEVWTPGSSLEMNVGQGVA
jgi:hypothetical protein